jgi:hypothetical protein
MHEAIGWKNAFLLFFLILCHSNQYNKNIRDDIRKPLAKPIIFVFMVLFLEEKDFYKGLEGFEQLNLYFIYQ